MSITNLNILDVIGQGETDKVEFKERLNNDHDIAKVLTAFANTEGGIVFIGVDDKGRVLGLAEDEVKLSKERLTKICTSLFTFPFDVGILSSQGLNIVYAQIDQAPTHLAPITLGNGEQFIRKGSNNIKVTNKTKIFSVGANDIEPKNEIIGFVAMSFRDEEEPSLIDYYQAMLRAAKRTDLPIKLTRIDLQEGDYEISQELMNAIDKADFILADYTLNSHNVYFEAGYARGKKKLIIQTARKGTALQFDVRNWTTILYRNSTELEEKLISRLKTTYQSITT